MWVLAAGPGCRREDITDGRFQGVIEMEQRDLGFELAGRITAVDVARGDEVAVGTPLARLDAELIAAAKLAREGDVAAAEADVALVRAGARVQDVRAVEAQLAAARATEASLIKERDRTRNLVARGAIASATIDDIDARLARAIGERESLTERLRLLRAGARKEEVARAEARVAIAREAVAIEALRLERAVLHAPVAGTVLDIHIEPGEVAGAGTPVVSLIDRRRPYADVFVPEPAIAGIRIGAAAELRVDGVATPWHGVVELVHPRAEYTPRYVFSPRERPNFMFRVRVRIDDPDQGLHAGLPCFVTIAPGDQQAAATGGSR